MHICFCVSSMECGGAEKVVSVLSNRFVSLGHKVTIVMVSQNKCKSFYLLNTEVKLIALCEGFEKRVRPLKRARLLKDVFLSIKPDVIISFLYHINVYAYFASKHTNIPLIVSERNDPASEPKKPYQRAIRNHVFAKADGCVFQTETAQQYFKKKYRNAVIIPNPVFLSISESEIKARDRRNAIVFVGSTKKEKNRKMAYDGFELFFKKHQDFVLEVYGTKPDKEEEEYVAKKGLLNHVVFKGQVKDWHKQALDAMAYILTSDFEGMPNSLLEATALGIPCVATDCSGGGAKCILEDGARGYLIERNDVQALCDKLDLISSDKDIQNSFVAKNKDLMSNYSIDHISSMWLSFVERVLKNHEPN